MQNNSIKDRIIKIATAPSRNVTRWKNEELRWGSFIQKLSMPKRTRETIEEYFNMPKVGRDNIKDVGGFVGGVLKHGIRKIQNMQERHLITLDADSCQEDFLDKVKEVFKELNNTSFVVYSTHSHTPKNPRYRVVIILSRPLTPEEYPAVAKKIAELIGINNFDESTYQAERLMYWPSASKNAEYVFLVEEGNALDVDYIIGLYKDWNDASSWPTSSKLAQNTKANAKQTNPLVKPGFVGACNRAYDIYEAMDKFLPGAYASCDTDRNRFTYVPGSSYGGALVYENGLFIRSYHGTDPIGGRLCNTFDFLRLHLFGHLDVGVKSTTPFNELPSYNAMKKLCYDDPLIQKELIKENLPPEVKEKADLSWLRQLKRDDKGRITASATNVLTIFDNDISLKEKVKYNEFGERIEVVGDLPWRKKAKNKYWSELDEACLTNYFNKTYHITSRNIVLDGFKETLMKNTFHPVRDYLNSLKWDGEKRIDTLFIDYLGAENNEYTRAITRKSLAAAVARIFNPGVKHDTILILKGRQGAGKSQILNKLGLAWFSDSLTTVIGKEAMEQLQGYWIIEIAELSATKKAEVEAVKSFLSRREDIFRPAYGRVTINKPRQCVFFATTNSDSFLKDSTGARRFWPCEVGINRPTKDIWFDLTKEEIDQIWAEAIEVYNSYEPLYLDSKSLICHVEEIQEQFTEENHYIGTLEEYLEKPIPKNWGELKLYERKCFLEGDIPNTIDTKKLVPRDRICICQAWEEALNGEKKNLSKRDSTQISDALKKIKGWEIAKKTLHFPIYGSQKGYIRSKTS